MPANNYQSAYISQKSFRDQEEPIHSSYAADHHRSRVLLSTDEYDNHHHGPYLPSNNKYKSTLQQQTAAPGYTYSSTVEKYMNKKIKSDQLADGTAKNLKRSFVEDSPSILLPQELAYKRLRSDYHVNEQIVVLDEINDEIDNGLNENKSVRIIRVERTIPAIGNDTLKLAQRTANE